MEHNIFINILLFAIFYYRYTILYIFMHFLRCFETRFGVMACSAPITADCISAAVGIHIVLYYSDSVTTKFEIANFHVDGREIRCEN